MTDLIGPTGPPGCRPGRTSHEYFAWLSEPRWCGNQQMVCYHCGLSFINPGGPPYWYVDKKGTIEPPTGCGPNPYPETQGWTGP